MIRWTVVSGNRINIEVVEKLDNNAQLYANVWYKFRDVSYAQRRKRLTILKKGKEKNVPTQMI